MRQRRLGSAKFKVSEVGMGCWALGGSSYGATDDSVSLKAIQKALELGCTFFDTADVYGHGHSEVLLGQALKTVRSDVIIATKVGFDFYNGGQNFSEEYIRFALNKSLERLQTDYVDLYQLHNPDSSILKDEKVFNVFDKLKEDGLIRNWGVSLSYSSDLIETACPSNVSTIQSVYNALQQEASEHIFPIAKDKDIGIIAREPLARGILTGKYNKDSKFSKGDVRETIHPGTMEKKIKDVENFKKVLKHREESLVQLALKFVLSNDAISTVIPGCKTPEQVEENMNSSKIKKFTKSELEGLVK